MLLIERAIVFALQTFRYFLARNFTKIPFPANPSKNHRRRNFLATFNDHYAFDMAIRSAFVRANNHWHDRA